MLLSLASALAPSIWGAIFMCTSTVPNAAAAAVAAGLGPPMRECSMTSYNGIYFPLLLLLSLELSIRIGFYLYVSSMADHIEAPKPGQDSTPPGATASTRAQDEPAGTLQSIVQLASTVNSALVVLNVVVEVVDDAALLVFGVGTTGAVLTLLTSQHG